MTNYWQITFDPDRAANNLKAFGYRVGSKDYGFLGLTISWYFYSYDYLFVYSSYEEAYSYLTKRFIPKWHSDERNIFHRKIHNVKKNCKNTKKNRVIPLIEYVD